MSEKVEKKIQDRVKVKDAPRKDARPKDGRKSPTIAEKRQVIVARIEARRRDYQNDSDISARDLTAGRNGTAAGTAKLICGYPHRHSDSPFSGGAGYLTKDQVRQRNGCR